MKKLTGYDIDGVLTAGIKPEGDYVIISGRTFAEYDDFAKQAAQFAPLYIRGVGKFGDVFAAAMFKATMINLLYVTDFYEDDPRQAEIIKQLNPECNVILVKQDVASA